MSKNKKSLLSFILLFGTMLITLQGQTTVSTTGGNTSGSQGSITYTIGQTLYTATSDNNGSVTLGVQQPYDITIITGVDEAKNTTLSWTTHPNPVSDNLRLTLGDLSELYLDNIHFELIDISGNMLVTKQITASETIITMNDLVIGNYFLRVYSTIKCEPTGIIGNRKEMKTFKIIKK